MAPEVYNKEPYNAKCDSYSFAILLWQMLSLKTPYELYMSETAMRDKIFNGPHRRPPIDDSWSPTTKRLLQQGWEHDIASRSSMTTIAQILRSECVVVRDGDERGLEHQRRRSTFVQPKRRQGQVSLKL
jgi:serine/threonine protein kinase